MEHLREIHLRVRPKRWVSKDKADGLLKQEIESENWLQLRNATHRIESDGVIRNRITVQPLNDRTMLKYSKMYYARSK
jgi:hypothetical protein